MTGWLWREDSQRAKMQSTKRHCHANSSIPSIQDIKGDIAGAQNRNAWRDPAEDPGRGTFIEPANAGGSFFN
jgi:hypothetical protein